MLADIQLEACVAVDDEWFSSSRTDLDSTRTRMESLLLLSGSCDSH